MLRVGDKVKILMNPPKVGVVASVATRMSSYGEQILVYCRIDDHIIMYDSKDVERYFENIEDEVAYFVKWRLMGDGKREDWETT